MYKLINDKMALHIEDEMHIPFSEDNKDYQQYLKWLEDGGIPAPVETLPPLLLTSLFKTEIYSRMTDEELDAFDCAIEAVDRRTRLMWRDCLEVQANSPLWPLLQFQMVQEFGPDRANAILSLDPDTSLTT